MRTGLSAGVSALLAASVAILIPMVPGGPVDTRSFAVLSGFAFWGFNVFLISLGLASVVFAFVVSRGRRWDFGVTLALGACYLAVWALDLGGIFPTSPDPMPSTLLLLEVLELGMSAALITLSAQGFRSSGANAG